MLAAGVGGCAYSGKGPIDEHFAKYKAGMPEGDKVFVCSSYGCRKQTPFKFTAADIAEVKKIMSAKRTATPADEREATKAALAWMGHRADTAVGTAGTGRGMTWPATATRGRWIASTWRPTFPATRW